MVRTAQDVSSSSRSGRAAALLVTGLVSGCLSLAVAAGALLHWARAVRTFELRAREAIFLSLSAADRASQAETNGRIPARAEKGQAQRRCSLASALGAGRQARRGALGRQGERNDSLERFRL